LKRTLLQTGDGSYTLHLPEWNEQYHSKHGAIAEALHVFIKEGLYYWSSENPGMPVSILEIGFGTGLNALLTLLKSENPTTVQYTGVEAYPLDVEEALSLNYNLVLENQYCDKNADLPDLLQIYTQIHTSVWEKENFITKNFQLTKLQQKFSEISFDSCFDLIYFDAFGIRVQPELWTEEIFQKMYTALKENGILVTYAANGKARRAMQAVGFTVERLPGPPGKKEMLRAIKRNCQ